MKEEEVEERPADWLWDRQLSRLEVLGNRGSARAPATHTAHAGYP